MFKFAVCLSPYHARCFCSGFVFMCKFDELVDETKQKRKIKISKLKRMQEEEEEEGISCCRREKL